MYSSVNDILVRLHSTPSTPVHTKSFSLSSETFTFMMNLLKKQEWC